MCGPQVLWNLLTLDVAFVMVLAGGSTILRARRVTSFTWAAFGLLSACVGAGLFAATYGAHTAMAAAGAQAGAVLAGGC